MSVIQIIIDDSTSKVITGSYEFDRANGGTLLVPSGSAFPGAPAAKELFWRTDESKLYRRSDANDAWAALTGAVAAHASTHGSGGSDAVTVAQSQVTNLVTDLAGKLPVAHKITDEHPRLTNVMSTGLLLGGNLAINALDPSTFDMDECLGIVVNNYDDPDSPTRTFIDHLGGAGIAIDDISEDETYLYLNASGNFVQRPDTCSDEERRDLIFVGVLSHLDHAEIDTAYQEPATVVDVKCALYDFFENFGAFNISGNVYAPADSNLKLQRSAGTTFDSNANYRNNPKSPNVVITGSINPAELLYYYRDLTGAWVNGASPTENADPDQYDTGTGLASVPSGKWTIQPIMFYAPWETTDIQYGQLVYDTYADARKALYDPVVLNPYNADWDTFRGWLIIKQGATDLSDPADAVLVPAGKLGLVSESSGGGTGGEVNTASNVGASGVGVYDSKVGVDLRFRKVHAASAKISVVLNSQMVDLDVVPGQIAHQDLSGAGTNAHSTIDTHLGSTSNPHSVTKTQVGLGNVTDDSQLKRAASDFATFTTKASPVAADILLIEDSADSGAKKKIQISTLPSSTPTFGANPQIEVGEGTSTTTSSTMQDKVTLTTPALTGTYRVAFFCEIMIGSANARHQCRLYNVTDAAELCFDDTRPTAASMYSARGGFQYVTFAGAAKTFKVQFASQNNSYTVTIRRARIEFWRIS